MKAILTIAVMLLAGSVSEARPNYFNLYVPQALANLGLNTSGWSGTCMNCHGATTTFGDYNNTFGTAFVNEANNLGFVLIANGADDLTQAQVQQIIQNLSMPGVDSDLDTFDNATEFTARTNVADATSNPGPNGGGTGGNVCVTNPTLPQCVGQNGGTGSTTSGSLGGSGSDQAYQLNSSCAAEETAMRDTRSHTTQTAGVLALWLLPILVSIIRRKS